MSFKKSFCPSPWFHMRITNSGEYQYCRWKTTGKFNNLPSSQQQNNLQTQTPTEYFKSAMSEIRTQLLNGERPAGCDDCYIMEQHSKVSGRQRQLIKVGILTDHFESSLASSPYREEFDYSYTHGGVTKTTPADWQIDLGNYCNSACIFCHPVSSSRLTAEFLRLGLIDQPPPANWSDDPVLLDKFCNDLLASKNLKYLHFIGGETLITPAFKIILSRLIEAGLAKTITIGFTTNLTVWSDEIVSLLAEFNSVNLGMSVESLSSINDYVRYPSKQFTTTRLLDQWVELAQSRNWLISMRITPTCLTVHELTTVYEYAWQHKLTVESCNFLREPAVLRISVLPVKYRQVALERLSTWINQHKTTTHQQIVNLRDPNHSHTQIIQDAESYLDYFVNAPDESHRLPELVTYLKKLESNRNNSILDYLPQYEKLFRSAGY